MLTWHTHEFDDPINVLQTESCYLFISFLPFVFDISFIFTLLVWI